MTLISNKLRRVSGNPTISPIPSLPPVDDSSTPKIQIIADYLVDTFASNSSDTNYSAAFLTINKLLLWFEKSGFKFSMTKSQFMLFSKGYSINHNALNFQSDEDTWTNIDNKLITLRKLYPIQNMAIRTATGAFKTSPASSLQAESDIPPLP
ncbi:Protein of unknown function [Cotesia congregata]|uniref:Uncharacterized protein n=1 Tax=Cotesia congregata TaxID=51543 RepID=A0A8J2HKA5_COTCN|nr:Protein of unknown function [Cotesia congregata]